jgi:hypothetical protein
MVLMVALQLSVACGDDATGDEAAGSSEDGTTQATTSSDESGEPLPEPAPAAGHCGYAGNGFACGWSFSAAHACPADAIAGGTCAAEGDEACCLDDATLLTCDCRENACDFQWYPLDCTHGPGAGACGWDGASSTYVCGGDGEDPGGTPIACDPAQPCDEFTNGTSCCDADGNAVRCTDEGSNGVPNYVITECATPT